MRPAVYMYGNSSRSKPEGQASDIAIKGKESNGRLMSALIIEQERWSSG